MKQNSSHLCLLLQDRSSPLQTVPYLHFLLHLFLLPKLVESILLLAEEARLAFWGWMTIAYLLAAMQADSVKRSRLQGTKQ